MRTLFLFSLLTFCACAFGEPVKTAANLVEWKYNLPNVPYRSGPSPIADKPTTAPLEIPKLPRLMVPRGTTNVARGKTVTSSDDFPIIGTLSMLTDGTKEGDEGNWVEIGPGPQWVQIDLEKPCRIYGIHIWHFFGETRIYRDVIVETSNDADFVTGVSTLFNNDENNSSGLGKGAAKEYIETNRGFMIDTRGPKTQGQSARYVRLYSRGNTSDSQNQYIEVEVIGQAAPKPSPPTAPPMAEYKPTLPTTPSQKAPSGIKVPPLPYILVPRDAKNLAYRKRVTSDSSPLYGSLQQITDGQKDVWLTQEKGAHWVQIDLEAPSQIYAIHLWHGFSAPYVYRDIRIQISDDKDFQQNVVTVFNNAHNKKSRLGSGPNQPYVESRNGLLLNISGPNKLGINGRYLRFWSNGNQIDQLNRYMEIAVIGTNDFETANFELPPPIYQ